MLLSAVFGSTSCNVDVPVSKCTPSPVKFSSKITPVAADVGKITDLGFYPNTSSYRGLSLLSRALVFSYISICNGR